MTDISIKKAQELRTKLEGDIARAITDLVTEFNRDTEIGINSVNVFEYDIETMGATYKKNVFEVSVSLDI